MSDVVYLRIDRALRLFVAPRGRQNPVPVAYDGVSSLGHVVQSAGVPLTEVGSLTIQDRAVDPSHRPAPNDVVHVAPPRRPHWLEGAPRFVLDVHLGSLARRLRILGVDTAYSIAASDDALVGIALTQHRVLLTKDRGLLRRRLMTGRAAYVRGELADEQLADVLDRFAPPLAPYTRCVACNGDVRPVTKGEVVHRLQAGTVRFYDEFASCDTCARVYWRGAHAQRLDAVVAAAVSLSSR